MVLLAGALYPSPLRQSLDVPVLCLPLDARHTLFDYWLMAVLSTPHCEELIISLDSHRDAQEIEQCVQNSRVIHACRREGSSPAIEVVVDAHECRGSGGALLTSAQYLADGEARPVVVAEASTVPPHDLLELLNSLKEPACGVVAGSRSYEPAGIYVFGPEVLSMLPQAAFLDLKEQVLPFLHERGKIIQPSIITDRVLRVRSRDDYLRAVQFVQARMNESDRSLASNAEISERARISSHCIICDGATIDDGAIIHESIILPGARIGADALIARSIIGANASVSSRSVVKDVIVDRPHRGCKQDMPLRSLNGSHNGGEHRLRWRSLLAGSTVPGAVSR